MSVQVLDQAIIASLEPLFAEAESRGLWFFHQPPGGDEVWCSPDHLRAEQAAGRLILAPEHWELRDPVGYMTLLVEKAQAVIDEYNELAQRLGFEENLAIESHSSNPADAH